MFISNPLLNPWLIVTLIIGFVVLLTISIIWGVRAHRFHVAAGKEEMVGKMAEVKTALEPKGSVLVEGERWAAISESGPVAPGEEVTITRVDGLKLYVTKKQ